ncbi:TcmI family type II polyketide cyclase [Spirillospora sp. CA-294931]|uniref:TcmI family type II polyketide cyclase n=1 Tax=Spirillospora sp. CA-294931 TaxID=3240042 RepID=UPI003D8EB08F
MMQRALLVMRMEPADAGHVARAFAEHDKGPQPGEVGVVARTLFHYNGLYFHLVEAPDDLEGDLATRIQEKHKDPAFTIVDEVNRYVSPYVEGRRGVHNARAQEFYHWKAGRE